MFVTTVIYAIDTIALLILVGAYLANTISVYAAPIYPYFNGWKGADDNV